MIVMLVAAAVRGLPTLSGAWTAAHSQGADQGWESFFTGGGGKSLQTVGVSGKPPDNLWV